MRKKLTFLFAVMFVLSILLMQFACTDDDDDSVDGDISTDGDTADGDTVADGDIADGDVIDGDTTDGDVVDGDVVDGDTDGDTSEGDTEGLNEFEQCVADYCTAELAACTDDAECYDLYYCIRHCGEDGDACMADCMASNPDTQGLFTPLAGCVGNYCDN